LPARILVVDDDPLSAELICEILRSASIWSLLVPTQGWSLSCKCLKRNGGDDETRTRDLCRDSPESYGNYLKLRGTDGYQNRALEPSVTIIGP
jgi:CheY-like chemotaxis protein